MARPNIISVAGFAPAYPDDLSSAIDLPVASAYGTDIYPGDPCIALTDGTVTRTPAGSAAGAATDGISFICIDVIQYRDPAGFVRRNGARYLPAATTYTADSDRSLLSLLPVTMDMIFRVRVNAANASIAVARATGLANADHIYTGADQGLGLSGARLNLSTLSVTATLQWRIIKWEDNRPSNDPTQADYSCLVTPNLHYAWPIVGHSTTAI